MRFHVIDVEGLAGLQRHVIIDRGNDEFTTFPAVVGNPSYDSFLESQSLTDAEMQAMEPDVWHDMA